MEFGDSLWDVSVKKLLWFFVFLPTCAFAVYKPTLIDQQNIGLRNNYVLILTDDQGVMPTITLQEAIDPKSANVLGLIKVENDAIAFWTNFYLNPPPVQETCDQVNADYAVQVASLQAVIAQLQSQLATCQQAVAP